MTRIPGTHPRVTVQADGWRVLIHGKYIGRVFPCDAHFEALNPTGSQRCRSRAAAVRWLVAQYDATLPTTAALGGSIPDLTGEQTTAEYIAAIRG